MAHVLLIGRGPLPQPGHHQTGFAQLRTRHFLQVLQQAGHSVDTVLIADDHAPGLLSTTRAAAQCADVVVSAGPHRPASVAVAAARAGQPLWIDLPGDPLSELQALALVLGTDLPPERRAEVHAMARASLSRADHLSVISRPQQHAAIGQLSLLGRIDHIPAPVSVIPIAYDFPFPPRAPRRIPSAGPVILALSGAFAPWFDDETLADGLERALKACPRLHVRVTGGGVPGHYTAGYERFQRWAEASSAADRIHLHGWVPHDQVPTILGAAHIGLCIDRPGSEPILGSRTRVLLFTWLGLHLVASPTTDLVADLVAHELCIPIPPGTAGPALADRLVKLVEEPPPPERVAAAHTHLATRYAPTTTCDALLDFVHAPSVLPVTADPVALVTRELETVREALTAVHGSPTWRLLSRIHGLLPGDS
ncbi:MAG: hypothetical protein CL927_15695 [Deltaproteobacteria bacterium]|nr:hypothetical protein [Deltaproteobacteria bacterium]HCH62253.1 hypothetical protein [Deltaproteobacteria bacterium]